MNIHRKSWKYKEIVENGIKEIINNSSSNAKLISIYFGYFHYYCNENVWISRT